MKMINAMNTKLLAFAILLAAGSVGATEVMRVDEAPTIDGKLSESVWGAAKWEGGFQLFSDQKARKPPADTEFTILADANYLYLGVKASHDHMDELKALGKIDTWSADAVEFYFVPDGGAFEFYQFLVSYQGTTAARFCSEGGNISPDPYGPKWEAKSVETETGWSAEAKIPLSAFYMTRGSAWRKDWKVNVTRTYRRGVGASVYACWIDGKGYRDLKNYRLITGFPERKATEDVWVKSVVAAVNGKQNGKITGAAKLVIYSAEPGEVTIETPFTEPTTAKLARKRDIEVSIPAIFPENGRIRMPIKIVRQDTACERTYPVIVDYQAIRLNITTPAYRGNFYPGQNSDVVAGKVVASVPGEVELTLEGPGFGRKEARLQEGGGTFSFDTKGFQVGDALLTIKAGGEVLTRKVRKLAPLGEGRHVSWIENGALIVDGKPVLRRNMYAEYYRGGEAFKKKYDADDLHQTKFMKQIAPIEPERLIKGSEQREATKDIKPSDELLEKLDKNLAAAQKSKGVYYYICDEPECRNISPVYLKYLYEYVCEKDPYHVILSCSRAGEKYIDCADWFETHPYINAHYDANNKRIYGREFNEVGDFISAFHPERHPDKCIGGTGTCFSYGGSNGDYPTFREYLANAWCEFLRGAKSLFPYAYHDLGDRAALYEGTRYLFTSAEVLEDILLKGELKTLVRTAEYEAALWTMPDGEQMFVVQNFTTAPLKAEIPGLNGQFMEFRGDRKFSFDGSRASVINLQPIESLVATTKKRGEGLPTYAETQALIDKIEKERVSRDNQLLRPHPESLGGCPEIEVTTSTRGTGRGKMFDGTRDVVAWQDSWGKNMFYEMSFPKMVAQFSEIIVYGHGLDTMVVKIRSGGEWVELKPSSVEKGEYSRRLLFDRKYSTVRIRLEFPKAKQVELYEIELPGKSRKPRKRASHESLVKTSNTDYWTRTYPAGSTTNVAWRIEVEPGQRYLTFEFRNPRRISERKYTAWNFYRNNEYLAGQITYPLAGLYTLRMPEYTGKVERREYLVRSYNLALDLGEIVCSREPPENRVEFVENKGQWAVRLTLKDKCEDVSCQLFHDVGRGPIAFSADGKTSFEMRRSDDEGKVWVGSMPIPESSMVRNERGNRPRPFVKAVVLGGSIDIPIYSWIDFKRDGGGVDDKR